MRAHQTLLCAGPEAAAVMDNQLSTPSVLQETDLKACEESASPAADATDVGDGLFAVGMLLVGCVVLCCPAKRMCGAEFRRPLTPTVAINRLRLSFPHTEEVVTDHALLGFPAFPLSSESLLCATGSAPALNLEPCPLLVITDFGACPGPSGVAATLARRSLCSLSGTVLRGVSGVFSVGSSSSAGGCLLLFGGCGPLECLSPASSLVVWGPARAVSGGVGVQHKSVLLWDSQSPNSSAFSSRQELEEKEEE
ncbi:hypothetical protein DNTS_000517 [Danionella cerebrum]|uniref:Uncharacterized protein n=1 Tax=Danionella cerebrum TaxID=2873325 RepID=A0A553NI11_9TELE|nr:hypothetical protein DNTS_000517 [Danionella translucida]